MNPGIGPFWQRNCRGKIAHLRDRKRDFLKSIGSGIILLYRNTFRKVIDDHILLKGCLSFINQSDDSCIEIVFNSKHRHSVNGLRCNAIRCGRFISDKKGDLALNGGKLVGLLCVLLLSACASAPAIKDFDRASVETSNEPQKMEPNFIPPSGAFASVVAEVEPVGEDLCRRFRPQLNCDFEVVVYKKNPNLVNAFQTIRSNGRPLVVFSQGLIEHARNEDELAFVLGHEMAHHLEGHLYQQYHTARSGAERFGGLISLVGASDRLVRNAERLGARLGGRKFSKKYELEADRLGTWIATIAGYDALRGAAFFMRMSDPADQLLGTHPPNQARVETVRKAIADLPSS